MKAGLLSLVAAVCASILVAGCGGESLTGARGASVVPATAVAFISIDSDPNSEQWQQADELADRFPGRADAVAEIEDGLRSETTLDFSKDVEPALGPELDFVWLDFANDGENVVALMQPKDVEAFQSLVAKGNAEDPAGEKLLYEEVDGWQVMSTQQTSIDAFKTAVALDGPVLADDDGFSQAMDDYSEASIFKAYVNGKTAMDEMRKTLSAEDAKFLDKVGNLDWIAAALRTTDDGIRFDTTVRGTPGELLRTSTGDSTPDFELSLPKQLPADVLAYIGFHGAPGSFSGLQDNPIMKSPELKDVRELVGKVGTLIEGEDALYVRPSKDGDIPEVTLITTPRAGTDGVATLDKMLKDAGIAAEAETTEIAGHETRRIKLGDTGIEIDYANVDGKLVVTTLPAGIEAVANPTDTDKDSSLRDAIGASEVPDQVQSFFYVDIRGGLGLVEELSGAPIPDAVKRNVKPLKSAVQYAASRPSEIQFTFFVRIDEPDESADSGTTTTSTTTTSS